MPRRPFLTTRAHEVFAAAHRLADRLGHGDVIPLHLAIAIMRDRPNVAIGALFNLGVPLDVLGQEFEQQLPPQGALRDPALGGAWTSGDERILDRAKIEAQELGTEHHSCEHLLLAFLRDRTSPTAQVLARYGIGYEELRNEVLRIYDARPEGEQA